MVSLASKHHHQITQRLIFWVGLWGLGVATASYVGLFQMLPLPLFALLVALGISIPTLIYYTSREFRAYTQAQPINTLTVFHLWRIPAALTFFYYGKHHLLPQTFVHNAAWGDLAAGLLVLTVLALPQNRWKYWMFHLFGMADFITAVGTGLTFTLLQVPDMETIVTFPIALIPAFGVGISGATHIMALDILSRGKARIS